MTNRITDGFDWAPSGVTANHWGANGFYKVNPIARQADVTTGRFSFGKAIFWNYTPGGADAFFGSPNGYVIPAGVNVSDAFIGCGVVVYTNGSPNGPALGFYDAVNSKFQVHLTFEPYGIIKAWRGEKSLGNYLGSSKVGAYQEDQWFHVEAKVHIASSGGTVEVRVNTVPVIQLTGANTQGSTISTCDSAFIGVHQTALNVAASAAIDDFFFNDTAGTTMNDWCGNLRSKGQFVIANGATDNFTIGGSSPAATNWQSVLNQAIDDTKFVYSPNVGDKDLYTPDPNLNAPYVRVLQVRAALRQDDATQRVARHVLRIGSTVYEGSIDHYTNQTFTFYKTRWELSPATGVSFTGTEVNGLQVGIKVQA